MEFLANVLPVDPAVWVLSKATMTKDLIKLEANGTASTTLTHEQVQFTPKVFKVEVKFVGEFDEFSPAAFAKLLIKDKNNKYQIFTAPFQVTSKTSSAYFMQALLVTNCADFKDLIFQFNTEEYVEITEWKLYPSSDIDTNTLSTVEAMLPQFLFAFNEHAISIGTSETEIVNLPFAMGEAGNLSCHLLFNYVVETSCKMIVTIKVDGSPEPYTPIVLQVQEGPGFVGIPHSFLQVQAAAHLISVTVKLEAYETQPSFNVRGSVSLPVTGTFTGTGTATEEVENEDGTTTEQAQEISVEGTMSGTAEGSISCVATSTLTGVLKATIQEKGVRYTCEGRGILDGQSGEYPHAEVSEQYEYPILKLGTILCSATCDVSLQDYIKVDSTELYTYPGISFDTLDYSAGLSSVAPQELGIAYHWKYNMDNVDNISIIGNLVLTSDGLTFQGGVGEGIATYTLLYPIEDYTPIVEIVKGVYVNNPNIRYAFSTDGSSWYTLDGTSTWQPIELTYSDMNSKGIYDVTLSNMDSELYRALFELTGNTKLTVAVYMISMQAAATFTLKEIVAYLMNADTEVTLSAPTITFAIPEANKARIHWQVPPGQPRSIKVYYGETEEFGYSVQAPAGATFCEVPGLVNKTQYYFAAVTTYGEQESELSNVVSLIPTLPIPRVLLCEAGISTITLQWQVIGILYDSFNVYIGTSEENLELYDNTTDTQLVLDKLVNNVEYYVAVAGIKADVGEESNYSDLVTARPLLPIPILSNVTAGKTSVNMTISLPAEYTGFIKYRVYYGTDATSLTDFVDFTNLEVSITDLVTDTQYYFYATGMTDSEESTPSNLVSAATDSSEVFTTLKHTGVDKPTQEDATEQYTQTVEVINGIQKYIIPETSSYLIQATGASGGKGGGAETDSKCLGGFGAIISGEFELNAGDELYMLVGQKGTDNMQTSGDATSGAGGGMTVVAIRDDDSEDILFDNTENKVHVRPLIVAGAGNGGGDASYSGVQGADALLDEGTSDAYLSNSYAGAGFRQCHNDSTCGKSFLAGGDAATYHYDRNGYTSYAGFGGGGANTDDGAGGGGAGYRGSYRGATFGGSSYNAGANPTAVLNTERTNGLIKIKKIGGTQ